MDGNYNYNTVRDIFFRFLKKNNAFNQYKYYLVGRDVEKYFSFKREFESRFLFKTSIINRGISGAFSWDCTKEGNGFWADLNDKWLDCWSHQWQLNQIIKNEVEFTELMKCYNGVRDYIQVF